jgi:hypothetical protein
MSSSLSSAAVLVKQGLDGARELLDHRAGLLREQLSQHSDQCSHHCVSNFFCSIIACQWLIITGWLCIIVKLFRQKTGPNAIVFSELSYKVSIEYHTNGVWVVSGSFSIELVPQFHVKLTEIDEEEHMRWLLYLEIIFIYSISPLYCYSYYEYLTLKCAS